MTFSKKRKPPLISRLFYSKPCLFVIGHLIKACLSLLFATCRISLKGKENITDQASFIIAFWHNQIVLAPLLRKILSSRRFCIIVSNSRDGHMLASFGKSYSNVSIIPVSHNKRHQALLQMCEILEKKEEIVLITPDGPRGPKHQVKPGIIYSAQKSGAPIVAMKWKASRMWEFSSWDKMRLPKPFSKIEIVFEKPFICPKNESIESLQEKLGKLLS